MPNDHEIEKKKVEARFGDVLWGPEVSELGAVATAVLAVFDGGSLSGELAMEKLKEIGGFGAEAAVWLASRAGKVVYGGQINIDHWETPTVKVMGRVVAKKKINFNRSHRVYVAVN